MRRIKRTKDVIIIELQTFEKYKDVPSIKLKRELKATLENWLKEEKDLKHFNSLDEVGKERFLKLDKMYRDSMAGKLDIDEEIEFFKLLTDHF